MYGAIDEQSSSPLLGSTTEFKVYKRRWLYLVCLCLANMSNAIVRLFLSSNFLKEISEFSYGLILHQLQI